MPFDFQQYQQIASPPSGLLNAEQQLESRWHYPWSEPVRFLINPRLRIAEIVSGAFAPVLNPDTQIVQFFESRWHYPWSEPKRFRSGPHPSRIPFGSTFFDNTPNPSNQLQGWYQEFRGPVWPKKGLRAYLQHTLEYHPRYLPPANVTAILAAVSIEGNDDAEFDVWAYDTPPVPVDLTAVNVSVTEIPATTSGNTSIGEVE